MTLRNNFVKQDKKVEAKKKLLLRQTVVLETLVCTIFALFSFVAILTTTKTDSIHTITDGTVQTILRTFVFAVISKIPDKAF